MNEAPAIADFVIHLRERLPEAEVIVIDGGSKDATPETLQRLRENFSLCLLRTRRGRALQMNAGVQLATGETLLFLHADSRLPPATASAIREALEDERMCGGCFRLRFPRQEWIYRVSDSLGNLAVDLFQIALGDHGIFCRREDFFRAGGYPLVPLMEDAQFYRRLKRLGRVRQLPLEILTSPRRYEEIGRYRTTFFHLLILIFYLLKVSPRLLARWHGKVLARGSSRANSSARMPVPEAGGREARLATRPEISVIIPVANEAEVLPECLACIDGSPNEIIVVDAGSDDATCSIALDAGCRLLAYPGRHRAAQMNHGATQARGRVLLFLHADTFLPPGALLRIIRAIDRRGALGGAFSRRYRSRSLFLACSCRLAGLRNRLFGWHLGDQAIFVRRDVFQELGGYREMALFEDLDFSRRLRSLGKTITLTPPVHSSARRFAARGPLRTTWHDLRLTATYFFGAERDDSLKPIAKHPRIA